ncbi:helix-turn-helix transcriptional regulator [Lysobacter sp. Root983]|uniref:helix-turn-helix domain-containing protein n=1 Tax=Lysobacter sp. Root983 TaxID=1736613 RepID=UPI000709E6DE|nr:helix-turn-helix transcriptional regulator [Lysobacter sp. Root983]KRD79738.1 transcriptional regulator [Lysobacter sp. Root983]
MDESTISRRLGIAVRKHRVALDLSQDKFADVIQMHRAYYSSIERGERNITVWTLWRVAEGLGVKPSDLMAEANL